METENTEKRIADKLKEFEEKLDEENKRAGLTGVKRPDGADFYLQLTAEQIKVMSPDQKQEGAYILTQLALHIQKEQNRHLAKKMWADSNCKILIGRQLSNFSQYSKYEEKFASIVSSDSAVKAMHSIVLYEEAYATELSFLARSIQTLANILMGKRND